MPGNPLFASHSLPSAKERVQNGAHNIRIDHSFNGLMFSSPMSRDSLYNLILDGRYYGGNREHDTIALTLSNGTFILVGDLWFGQGSCKIHTHRSMCLTTVP